ncbi:MAG: SAM-dependent chlorinase/fluorinase [Candidatus Aegiribacteria sp.]|nr:SAM-dependent chlorinase/fluorinase [Candidatus Aegiribacteria sp.]
MIRINILFLLSDFGASDTYVAQMKAVIFSECSRSVVIIDLTHDVKAGSISEAAFHLYVSAKHIPAGSVVVAVVDPGVGTARRGVVCKVEGVYYVGPDNGIFGLLPLIGAWKLPDPHAESSSTFHGRDVFAPAGARLLLDPGWVDSLEPIDKEDLVPSNIEMPIPVDDGLKVTVAHIDVFGNIILWLPLSSAFRPAFLQLPCGRIEPVTEVETYDSHPGILFLQGSGGLIEIAVSCGSASELLGLSAGDRILLIKECNG